MRKGGRLGSVQIKKVAEARSKKTAVWVRLRAPPAGGKGAGNDGGEIATGRCALKRPSHLGWYTLYGSTLRGISG